MAISFPPVDQASEDGLLAFGGSVNAQTLELAYTQGIFPWPVSPDYPMTWFSPDPRGILEFKDFKVSKSFKKFLKKTKFEVRFNENFPEIIHKCSKMIRKHEVGTWIHPSIIKGYTELFQESKAYCVGTYLDGELVGGLYGTCFGEIISGESMFHKKSNASKFALYHLVKRLEKNGVQMIDTQMVTSVIASFGGKNIPRQEFIQKLKKLDTYKSRKEIFSD